MPSAISGLLELTDSRAPGPSPSFDRAQFLFAFLTIGSSGTIGRASLAKKAGLGEGAVRTVLKKLRSSGYAEVGASGCRLTPAGASAYGSVKRRLTGPFSIDETGLNLGRFQAGLAIRGGGRLVKGGLEQRDSAIKAGASGATTYVIKGRKFTIPGGSSDCEAEFPGHIWTELRGKLSPRDGDAIIMCGSSDEKTAVLGSISAALTLLQLG